LVSNQLSVGVVVSVGRLELGGWHVIAGDCRAKFRRFLYSSLAAPPIAEPGIVDRDKRRFESIVGAGRS